MVDPSSHGESRGAIESLLRKLPGFQGYLEREYRRESDQLARTWLADRLEQCKLRLDRYQRSLLDAGQIDYLDDCERLRKRLDTLASRARGAVRGYSGLFDFVRVDVALLDQVYEVDLALIDEADWLVQSLDELAATHETSPDELASLTHRVEALHRDFDRRGELLQGLGSDS